MKRREFVKGLAVTAAATTALAQQKKASPQAATPVPNTSTITQGEQAVAPNNASAPAAQARQRQMASFKTPNIPLSQPDVVAVTDVRYFTPVRYATLTRFADLLVPASQGYPGALQAGAPEFLDFLIGASPADRQAMYNDGLDRLNADCLKKSGVPFAKATAAQADAAVRPYLKGWINDHPPTEKHENFIALSHRDIRQATMNSVAWAQAAEVSGERVNVGLYVHPLDPGIETWVNHGAPKASAPLTKQAHS
jgi:hypothetical protein